MQQIQKLREKAFDISLQDDKVKIIYVGDGSPDAEALALIHELQSRKTEVVQHLENENKCPDCGGTEYWQAPWFNRPECAKCHPRNEEATTAWQGLKGDNFHVMFQKAADAIAKHYAAGSLDWLELYHPDKYAELCRLHDELEKVWQTQDEALFREALKQWYVAHIETMKLFRKNEGWLSTANRKLASQGFCVLRDSLSNEYFLIVNNDSVSVPDKCKNHPKYTVNEVNTFPEVSREAFMQSHSLKKAFKAKHIENAEGWPWQ